MVSSRIFLRNSLEQDLLLLYRRLVDLGMEYRRGHVYLADLNELPTIHLRISRAAPGLRTYGAT